MSTTAMVTGATGFIGRRLVGRLLHEGRPVRVLVRSPARLPPELRPAVAVVVGGLDDPTALRAAMEGAGAVFHLAGLAAAWSRRRSDFFDTNVEGVRRLLVAAQLEGVQRVVHVSTVLTLFPADAAPTAYVASKLAGERLVRQYVAAGGDAVLVHPCRVYGPGPLNDANGVSRLVRAYLRGPLPARLRDGGVRASYVHVDDVAEGLLLAERRGRPGASYVLGGECSSVEDLFATVSELTGVRRPVLRIPPWLALAVAGGLELAGQVGAPVPITRAWVRSFLQDQSVEPWATTEALGFQPRPLRVGLSETIAWLNAGGLS